MSETAAKLLEQALDLPEADRLLIADRLWDSLDRGVTSDPDYLVELEERLKEVDEHPERLIDWKDAMVELRKRLDERRHGRCNNPSHSD